MRYFFVVAMASVVQSTDQDGARLRELLGDAAEAKALELPAAERRGWRQFAAA